MPIKYVLLVVLGLVAVGGLVIYNALVRARNQIDNLIGTMDAMLKKRWDLVPNLVAAVKGYAQHERDLLDQITQLRSQVRSDLSTQQKVSLDNMFSQLLAQLQAVVERYPDLKASQNFIHLQRALTELEEQISAARRAFNAAVTEYNNLVQTFPSNIVAGMLRFHRRELFHIEAEQAAAPQVWGHEDTTRGTDIL